MRLITLLTLCFNTGMFAQTSEILLDRSINPSALLDFNTPAYHLNFTMLNQKIGLNVREVGSIFRIKNNVYQSTVYQYGYEKFQESSFRISTAKKLSNTIEVGLRVSYNYLYIYEFDNLSAVSFDLGFGFKKDRFVLRLLLENPLNAAYRENDLESQFIISSRYWWTESLNSTIRFEESLLSGLSILHRIKYSYRSRVSLLISQRLKPLEYGYGLGFKIKNLQFYSRYIKYSYTNALGLCIIYTPKNE